MNRTLLVPLLLCALAGCTAVTNFDRSRIQEGAERDASATRDAEPTCAAIDGGCGTAICGNGKVESGETCDPPASCPSACDDGTACTSDRLVGAAASCNAACEHQEMATCRNDDGCCPSRCTSSNDSDCSTSCGNGQTEPGETCDPTSLCPLNCNDGNACTIDKVTGSLKNCNLACSYQAITRCVNDDGCCPAGCNAANDSDCTISCGNEVVEPGETCDPPGSCPTSCEDGNACTLDALTGSAANCNVACSSQVITQCNSGDGCCPAGCNANNDKDCTNTCNNAIVEPGETCDPPGSCPASCNDGTACTIDSLTGSSANCTAACRHQQVTQCQSGDGCCPAGCNANNDNDCTKTCNNGVVEPGETCDPPGSCMTNCNDGSACTIDRLSGSAANCTAACTHQTITQCVGGDGCCPPGCNNNNDRDCSASCNNGVVEAGETCDPRSSCPANKAACNDGNACTLDSLSGSANNCTAACTHQSITQCAHDDGCCPPGCNNNNDRDCSASCNNSVVEQGETCDPSASCPASCSDGNACTIDGKTGSAANCNLSCTHQTITQCAAGDSCCPPGCNANNDGECSPSCGNGAVEPGETCDPPGSCRTTCNDGNACTVDSLTGSATNCNVACSYRMISECSSGDGCCPTGCNANTDHDCSPSCGNGSVEMGETCDPQSSCPASCNDGNACTIDGTTGSASNCNVSCTRQTISQCQDGDQCCPSGCNANNDDNCSASCGNKVVEMGETCDPPSSCPASCSDGNACTIDTATGSAASCTAGCTHQSIVQCVAGDDCCPAGCFANDDTDCSAHCGNGHVEPGETCDPPGSCPTTCNDNVACTIDMQTGSASSCSFACSHQTIITCANHDGCCPPGCDANTDNDCPVTCGNSKLEAGETCDPPASCPTSCDDDKACTQDGMTGSAASCTAACTHQPIMSCQNGDGCCPTICNMTNDSDCRARCDNSVVEQGETCDPPSSCPTTCPDDGNPCTSDMLTGSAATCNAECVHVPIADCPADAGADTSPPI